MILAFDPGEVTGIAEFYTQDEVVLTQSTGFDAIRFLEARVSEMEAVVCESFIITGATLKKSQQAAPLRIQGALEYICAKNSVPFVLQSPSEAKRFADDRKLRLMGWYQPGAQHGRDAARHLLLYCVKQKIIPLSALTASP